MPEEIKPEEIVPRKIDYTTFKHRIHLLSPEEFAVLKELFRMTYVAGRGDGSGKDFDDWFTFLNLR